MNKKVLIILIISFSTIGIILFTIFYFNNSFISSNMSKKLESKWNSSERIGRINNSKEEITFKKIDIVVILEGKKYGDTNSKNPLIIDLNEDNIIFKNKLFSNSCVADFTKNIRQNFKLQTDSTSITTNINGKITYQVNYEIRGNKNYKESKEIISNLIMRDIYDNTKSNIKFGIPEIKTTYFKVKKEDKFNNKSSIKL
jgi:hypothetical protein